MDPSTREPVKIIPCEFCGSEAKLLCFCRKCSLCESCIGKHLISEPTLAHKPVTFSQSEIAAQYEREFTEIREHEQRLMKEVSQRQEETTSLKVALKQESQRLEQFKSACLEYVALAVEVATQKLAQVAEVIGKEMVEKCQEQRAVLEEASNALEGGEEHHYLSYLRQGNTSLLDYKIDLKEVNPEGLLRAGIDFHLEPLASKQPIAEKPVTVTSIPKFGAKKPSRLAESTTAVPTPKNSTTKTRTDTSRLSQSMSKRPVGKTEEAKQAKSNTVKLKVPDIDLDPSPGPPLARAQTEAPSNAKNEATSKTGRAQLLSQTAKNVLEMSALVESMRTPKDSGSKGTGFFAPRTSSKSPLDDESSSPTSEDNRRGMARLSLQPNQIAGLGFSLLASARRQAEEEKTPKERACLYSVREGTSQLWVHDLALQTSEVKTFEGIDPFLKGTFSCLSGPQVFILGGVGSESLPSTIKKVCWIFSVHSDTMEQGPNMHICRYNCSAICFKDSIFVSGGIGIESSALKDCERLDIKTRKWRKAGNLNVSRESHAMTEHIGRLYVAGGPGAAPFETYNPVNDRWALINIKANTSGKATMFSAEDRIVVLHDKTLTNAWIDKRNSKDTQELPERGWWTGGVCVRCDAALYFVRGDRVYAYDLAAGVVSQVEGWAI